MHHFLGGGNGRPSHSHSTLRSPTKGPLVVPTSARSLSFRTSNYVDPLVGNIFHRECNYSSTVQVTKQGCESVTNLLPVQLDHQLYDELYTLLYDGYDDDNAIRLPTSTSSLRPLRSLDRRKLFVPRTTTTMVMSRSFSVIAPSLWNRLPPSARASLSSSNLSTSLSLLKTCLFSWS